VPQECRRVVHRAALQSNPLVDVSTKGRRYHGKRDDSRPMTKHGASTAADPFQHP
jgi:hypothetical protein